MYLKLILPLFLLAAAISGCNAQEGANKSSSVAVVTYPELQEAVQKDDDRLYVVNFWATWCQPCVAELPDFMAVNAEMASNEAFEMILVSLDDVDALKSKVLPFIKNHQLEVRHFLLNDIKNMNEWIPDVNATWSGAIPATVFYLNGKAVHFVEGKLSKSALQDIISEFL